MDITQEPQRIISICTGIRGLETGLERAGVTIQPVVYIEIEAVLCANLVAGMEAGILAPTPIYTDVKSFYAKPFRGKIHGIVAGYPCPDFSVSGKRRGKDGKRYIWPYIRQIIETTRPIWCFFENVAGHLTLGYDEVYRSLRDLGYAVEAGIFTAEEAGAPHLRERLFILALANGYSFNGRLSESTKRQQSIQITGCGEKLVNTNSNGYGTESGGFIEESGEIKKSEQWQEWNEIQRERLRDVIGNAGSELVNTTIITERKPTDKTNSQQDAWEAWQEPSQRCQQLADSGSEGLEIRTEQSAWEEQQTAERSSITCWPARPGQQQYEWEPNQSITKKSEPDLGLHFDGYSFREDLLRALGNAVVPQCAEIAFLDLLEKHKKNSEIHEKKNKGNTK